MVVALAKIPTGRAVSAREMAAIEASNNRRAVKRLRFFLRWALSEIDGDAALALAYDNARKLLAETTTRKLRGAVTVMATIDGYEYVILHGNYREDYYSASLSCSECEYEMGFGIPIVVDEGRPQAHLSCVLGAER